MTPIVLGALSAFLFGLMTVCAARAADRRLCGGRNAVHDPPGLAVTAVAAIFNDWNLGGLWPFLLAGLLAPGASQLFFTFGVRDAGASRTSVVTGTAPLFAVAIAFLFLDEPVVAGLVLGATLIVGGGVVLASEPTRPVHFRRIGLVFALLGTIAFAVRDNLVRWLGLQTDAVDPGAAAFATMATGATVALVFAAVTRASLTRRGAVAFLPAALCYGASYVLLFEAFYRGRVSVADRRDRVALGRDAVVAPLAQVRARWTAARPRRDPRGCGAC